MKITLFGSAGADLSVEGLPIILTIRMPGLLPSCPDRALPGDPGSAVAGASRTAGRSVERCPPPLPRV